MSEVKKISKWWWPWQTGKIEGMLEDMAAQGWVLKRTGGMLINFTFEKAEPVRIRYCIDYQEKEKQEYLMLLNDAGWKMEHKRSGWYIWSKAYEGEKPELYTDVDSLVRRNNAILGTLAAVFAALVCSIGANFNTFTEGTPFGIGLFILWVLLEAVLAGIVIGMAAGNRRLKRRKGAGRWERI